MKYHLLSMLFLPLTVGAHSGNRSSDVLHDHCEVVTPPLTDFPQSMFQTVRPLGEPSYGPSAKPTEQVFDNGYEYIYRLAFCVSPEITNKYYHGDPTKVRQWMEGTIERINEFYSRDFGIRFELVFDERLILTSYPEGYSDSSFEDYNGTKIINSLIEAETYDVGILIRPKHNGLAGRASLGVAYSALHKGNAMATTDEITIAHEMGHMFGAKHTHLTEDGLCIEPGEGQSIMSYGNPRTSFSLASVLSVRRQLKTQPYYPNSQRNPDEVVRVGLPDKLENIPYVVKSTRTKPELDRKRIRKNYTITEGTRYQFTVPVVNPQESFTYGAQSNDAAIWNFQTNTMQPIYSLTKNPTIMFQPYYDMGKNEEGRYDAILVPHSDEYRAGRYTYLLAAADGARYDLETVTLNIVKGKPFQMTTTFDWQEFQGKPLTLDWEPCTQLYGADSKVRILLSDDFGQTFKYVLDDQVPNTGHWEGAWPFINIGRAYYRNFDKPIRGGVIKIEVIGEAAYTVSKEVPDRANPNLLYSGGFELMDYRSYIRFNGGPKPFVRLKKDDTIPEMPELEAYHKNGLGRKMVKGQEEREGNVIRRKWTAEINGVKGTYSQLILIDDPDIEIRQERNNRADEIKLQAADLYRHPGELGYPLPSLPVMQRFRNAYEKVFDANDKLKAETTTEEIEALRALLDEISMIADNDIVKPAARHYYKLRNYQDMYGHHSYYYLGEKKNPDDRHGFTADEANATVWQANETEGQYSLTNAEGKDTDLEPFLNPGNQETMKLDRGFTWGAFTLVNGIQACAQLSQQAKYLSRNEYYRNDPMGFRTNRNGTVSTDFQFVPVDFVEARTSVDARPWNILTSTDNLVLNDSYTDIYVGRPVTVKELNYQRTFDHTEWEPLYLPFDTRCADWMQHCEVASIEGIRFDGTEANGGETVMEYQPLTEGQLLANRPYLIRAKQPGTYTFTLQQTTVQPTEETRANLPAADYEVNLCGNYGVLTGQPLKQQQAYLLEGNMLRPANGTTHSLHSMRWYLSVTAQNSGHSLPAQIRLVKKNESMVGTLTIATAEGYGTIYTDRSYVMPQGMEGYVVTQANADRKELTIELAYTGGETVPAHAPLLVKGEKRTYTLYAPQTEHTETVSKLAGNLLQGSATTTMTQAPQGQSDAAYYFYKLYYGDPNHNGTKVLGFFWGSPDGAPFKNQANKAYLALTKVQAQSMSGFALPLDGPSTGITLEELNAADETVYTLTGIRLFPKSNADLQPGIYLINGKKVIIK